MEIIKKYMVRSINIKAFLLIFISVFWINKKTTSQTFISGEITTNTIWSTDNHPYIIEGDLTINEGVKLTIQPGIIVKVVHKGDDIYVCGSLDASGTPENPIVFTSYFDDEHGGDTNGDSSQTYPSPGHWGCITFRGSSIANRLEHVWIGYGGGSFNYSSMVQVYSQDLEINSCTLTKAKWGCIYVYNVSLNMQNCLISDNGTNGIYFFGLITTTPVKLSGNQFINNPNRAVTAEVSKISCDIILNGNISEGSAYNGFTINGQIAGDVIIDGDSLFPFIMSDCIVPEEAHLSLLPGTIIKFTETGSTFLIDGSLVAQGASQDSVIITSLKDDRYGGDTNGDSTETIPSPGDWSRIIFSETSTGNILEYFWTGYGGFYSYIYPDMYSSAMININTSDLTIRNCTFTNAKKNGMFVAGVVPDISHCVFSENGTRGIYFYGDVRRTIQNCMFSGNGSDGIYFSDYIGHSIRNCIFSRNKTSAICFQGEKTSGTIEVWDNQFINNEEWAIFADIDSIYQDIILTGNISSGSARNGFGITGKITGDVLFNSDSTFPFIVTNISVAKQARLTLSPGTILKFDDYNSGLEISGSMVPNGTPDHPAVFTSLKDDQHGGDTNGDSTETSPEPGDWGGIILKESAQNHLIEHLWIGYGGIPVTIDEQNHAKVDEGALSVHAENTEIRYCTITSASHSGIFCERVSPYIHDNKIIRNIQNGVYYKGVDTFRLENNYFQENGLAVFLYNFPDEYFVDPPYSGITRDIILTGTGNVSKGLGLNGFGISGTIKGDLILVGDPDFPFIVYYLNIERGKKLTFKAGEVIKFGEERSGIGATGSLNLLGTKDQPVIFTSIKDDDHGGDTNGDGESTSPKPGDWGRISFSNNDAENFIYYAWIGYGGTKKGSFYPGGMIEVYNSSSQWVIPSIVKIDNCTITRSGECGLHIDSNSSPEIRNSKITKNYYDGINVGHGSLPLLQNNEISDNGHMGVNNTYPYNSVDVRYNWWGDSSGPWHAANNPSGKGNKVSDNVLFKPFLANPPDLITAIEGPKPLENFLTDQIYPNPVFSIINIPYSLIKPGIVVINVLNIEGKKLKTILNEYNLPGDYTFQFDLNFLSPGVYYIQMISEEESYIKPFIVMD